MTWNSWTTKIANITIKDLDVDLDRISQINADGFDTEFFSKMKSLTLRNGNLDKLFSTTFAGLSIEKLVLTNHRFCNDCVISIEQGVLEPVSETLKSFTLIEASEQIQIPIDRILGSGSKTLPNIVYVKIQYKMNVTNSLTFTAIPNVKELDLSSSHLAVIADEFTFATLTKLELLNLENNQLKTLPAGIFNGFYESIPYDDTKILSIRLAENPWECCCNLEHLIGNFSNFDGDVLCDIRGCPIKDTIFCAQPQTTSTTFSKSPSTTRSTITTSSGIAFNNYKNLIFISVFQYFCKFLLCNF